MAIKRINIYYEKFKFEYEEYPDLLRQHNEEIQFDKISEWDSDMEVCSDEADNAIESEQLVGSSPKGVRRIIP